MRIWIDITNTPHVIVLVPIIKHLEKKHELIITARDFSETVPLLKQKGIEAEVYGSYRGKSRINKVLGLFGRMVVLLFKVPRFDFALSLGGNYTATIAFLRGKKSIVFSDNDISFKYFSYRLGHYFIFPKYFNYRRIQRRYRIRESQIFAFDGFKEDIYLADFVPDGDFVGRLPFRDYIVVRPENLKASYVPKGSRTIVPELFERFAMYNILFLPRYEEEKQYAEGHPHVWYPERPLSGLDVCYNAKAVLTGAGTFAREAALMGVPAVSFFPGETFLSVDVVLQDKGFEYKSRNPDEIYRYVTEAKRGCGSTERSVHVQKEVFDILDTILNGEGELKVEK